MTNVPEVTDADVRLWSECVKRGENEAQAIARARAEGAASEREACAVECDRAAALIRTAAGMVVGNSTAAEVKRGTRTIVAFALDQVAANIRARGEGGKA